jgi:hypothetical protein
MVWNLRCTTGADTARIATRGAFLVSPAQLAPATRQGVGGVSGGAGQEDADKAHAAARRAPHAIRSAAHGHDSEV